MAKTFFYLLFTSSLLIFFLFFDCKSRVKIRDDTKHDWKDSKLHDCIFFIAYFSFLGALSKRLTEAVRRVLEGSLRLFFAAWYLMACLPRSRYVAGHSYERSMKNPKPKKRTVIWCNRHLCKIHFNCSNTHNLRKIIYSSVNFCHILLLNSS